jgi:hypothetical protein
MANNANILLQGNADLSGGINKLFQGIEAGKNSGLGDQNRLFQQQNLGNSTQDARFKSVFNAAQEVLPFLQGNDTAGAKRMLENRRDGLKKAGLSTEDTDFGLSLLEQDPSGQSLLGNSQKIIQAGSQRFGGADSSKLFQPTLVIDPKTGKPVLIQASNNPNKDPRVLDFEPAKDTAEQKSARDVKAFQAKESIKSGAAADTVVSTAKVTRAQQTIQAGLDAVKGIPSLRRTIGLLDTVKTGGFANASLKIKQALGIEGADEGELSSNMGQAILRDLRTTFGAAFTEREGARLESIRANFGRNAATNKRLINQTLQIAEDAAKRAMKQAADQGDFRTAQEIQEGLSFEFTEEETAAPASRFTIEEIK